MNRPDTRTLLDAAGLLVLLAVVVPFVVFAVPQAAGADHSYVVLSGSMSPAIHAGDVVLVTDVPPSQIQERDVITFEPPSGHQMEGVDRVTHRVVDVVDRDGERYFRTKGDANEEPDRALVPPDNVVGVVTFVVPYVGYAVNFAHSGAGWLALVVVPGALLVLNEVWTLYRAAKE
ncbi:MAG: signal peptidase I [Halobacteriaceae archaeon]